MIELNLSAIFSSSPNKSSKNKFWKSPKQDKSLLKNGGVLMCNNLEDAEALNNLIAQKVKSLKTVENVYVRDITNLSKIIIKREEISMLSDDTYAEVFDSLNNIESPPPLPSRRNLSKPPARPPYPSSLILKQESKTIL